MPDFTNSVPLKAATRHILFIELPDPFLTPEKNFREFIIEVSELYILLLSTKEMNYIKFNFRCPLYLYFLLNFLYCCHSSDLNYLLLFGPLKSLCALSPSSFFYNALRSTPLHPFFNHSIPLCVHVSAGWLLSFKTFTVLLFPKE